MEETLLRLRQEAAALAGESKRIEDYKSAADTWKAVAEAWKAQRDAENQQRLIRFEGLKSFATFVVPFLTLLTLLVTIWLQRDATLIQRDTARLQAEQVKATIEANEDIQWREAVKALAGSQSVISGLAAQEMLKPLRETKRYHDKADELAIAVMGRVSDEEGFRDLFDSTFRQQDWSTVAGMLIVARTLAASYHAAADAAKEAERQERSARLQRGFMTAAIGGVEATGSKSGNSWGGLPPAFVSIGAANAYVAEMRYVCPKLAAILRLPRPQKMDLDLSGVMLLDCDLSGTNLSRADLTGAQIQASRFEEVDLSDLRGFKDSKWPSTPWWRAGRIDTRLLALLSKSSYPYPLAPMRTMETTSRRRSPIQLTSLASAPPTRQAAPRFL
ncbi:MAG TPA: pentapeptide repeat-containing protein [Albitalea sp.]|uniref:pentapeptide repeat-containing protein n=1 Tax=Piscinibacter sp. TaxID=1903157 RepID=UPI002ED5E0AA